MAYTELDRDRLKRAIASGILTVDHPQVGRVTYRDLPQLQRALSTVEAELSLAIDPAPPTRRVVVTTRSGF